MSKVRLEYLWHTGTNGPYELENKPNIHPHTNCVRNLQEANFEMARSGNSVDILILVFQDICGFICLADRKARERNGARSILLQQGLGVGIWRLLQM